MFDFLFMVYQKRLKNRLNVRSFVRCLQNKNRCFEKIFYTFLFSIILASCKKESINKENDMPSFEAAPLMKSAAWSNLIKLSNNQLLLFYQKAENLNIPNQGVHC